VTPAQAVVRELPEAGRPAHGALVVPAVEARPSTSGEGRSAVLLQPDRLRVCVVMATLVGCLGITAVIGLYLFAIALTETDTAPYDPEDDQW
jgi:hypothetical protein